MREFLEDRDVASMVCSLLRIKEMLSVRATCKGGRDNTKDVFCPREAWKRVLKIASPVWLKQCRHKDTLMCCFAREGQLDLLQWARTGRRPAYWTCIVATEAAKRGDLEMLKWMYDEADPPLERGNMFCPDGWIAVDRVTLLYPTRGVECAAAAKGGQLETLKWLRAQEPPFEWTGLTFENAVMEGHLDVCKWINAQDPKCPWGKMLTILLLNIRSASHSFELLTRRAMNLRVVTGYQPGDDNTKLLKKHMPIIEWVYPLLAAHNQESIRNALAELNIVLR